MVPILETVRAPGQVDALSRVDGEEAFFFGPADLSATAGYRGQWQGPGVAEATMRLQLPEGWGDGTSDEERLGALADSRRHR
ncbi:hypothetical protein OJF2_37790 [Aquisphaera giovannonii]|uniref:Uncharacterized protein n=1 Tax=Aquisphaera giovannonii TaxID=406548 RepID=A0A5B9W3R3_9BACT|nr:hypothetical protein OJF2_37790 [Aquisphaera giovannonii]